MLLVRSIRHFLILLQTQVLVQKNCFTGIDGTGEEGANYKSFSTDEMAESGRRVLFAAEGVFYPSTDERPAQNFFPATDERVRRRDFSAHPPAEGDRCFRRQTNGAPSRLLRSSAGGRGRFSAGGRRNVFIRRFVFVGPQTDGRNVRISLSLRWMAVAITSIFVLRFGLEGSVERLIHRRAGG